MVRVILDHPTILNRLLLCVIPSHDCPHLRVFYCRSWGRARSTGFQISMVRCRSRRCCRRVCRISCSMAPPVSRWAWRPIYRRTIYARSLAPVYACWKIRVPPSMNWANTLRARITPPKQKSSPLSPNYAVSMQPVTGRSGCAQFMSEKTVILFLPRYPTRFRGRRYSNK